MPYFHNHKMKSAGTPIARHFGGRYPFGHGLDYTSLEFSDLKLGGSEVDVRAGELRVSFLVRNTGARADVAVCRYGVTVTITRR